MVTSLGLLAYYIFYDDGSLGLVRVILILLRNQKFKNLHDYRPTTFLRIEASLV